MHKKSQCILQNKRIYLWSFGSATPDIGTYYRLQKQDGLLTLTERAGNAKLPKVEIIDMKQELANRQ